MGTKRGEGFISRFDASAFLRKTDLAMDRKLQLAAIAVEGHIKELISLPGPTKTHKTGSIVKNIQVRASAPGEPPRKRTGTLRASIRHWKIADNLYWVGTPLRYGLELEKGTRAGLKPRPYLDRALQEMTPYIKRLLTRWQ